MVQVRKFYIKIIKTFCNANVLGVSSHTYFKTDLTQNFYFYRNQNKLFFSKKKKNENFKSLSRKLIWIMI